LIVTPQKRNTNFIVIT